MSLTRLLIRYQTVKILHEEKEYSIQDLCPLVHIARSSYYKWLNIQKVGTNSKARKFLCRSNRFTQNTRIKVTVGSGMIWKRITAF